MTVKAINITAGLNGLVSTFLVFETYFCMSEFDFFTPTITQSATILKNTMKKLQKIKAKRQVADALNVKNRLELMVFIVHNLLLDSDILIWQKNNAGYSGK